MATEKGNKLIAENRKAYHDYHIEERMEAGIELFGTEVKSIRQGKVNLSDSYAAISGGELWLHNMHISPYEQGNRYNHDPMRQRRLLMHKHEILRLFSVVREKGLTLVPTKLYFKRGRVKVEVGLARGKKNYDKRESLAKKQANREIERRLKEQSRRPD
ncbi:MAG: SsrA-binding protein SmpB [Saccharofermentanales bacterium]|jgi:SsrA-binding protein|nr:SsrA-binding protein SmpB [Clostridiaceae bacterium]